MQLLVPRWDMPQCELTRAWHHRVHSRAAVNNSGLYFTKYKSAHYEHRSAGSLVLLLMQLLLVDFYEFCLHITAEYVFISGSK